MSEPAPRVALLAREGEARERLRQALGDAGVELVATADPLAATIGDVTAAAPQAVLVALEPEIEDALDAWSALLLSPDVTVIYDEAELAAQRSGWDAARWARHLRAKLHNHDDVLPPGTEPEDALELTPGPLPEPVAEPADEGLEAWFARMSQGDDAAAPDPEAGERRGTAPVPTGDGFSLAEEGPLEASAPPARTFNLDGLRLAEDDGPIIATDGDPAAPPDLETLEERIAGLSLADVDSYGHGPERGAVLVEAGLGGPDAIRQLLASLSEGFPRPVLVRMRLDGGRYDRLVRQMDRATVLPVALAEEGGLIEAGKVYFLSPGVTPVRDKGELRFTATAAPGGLLPEGLPVDDSAILLLSGSDTAVVEEAMALALQGTLVMGQAAEDSFDPAAGNLLGELGGSTAAPAAIAASLMERWPIPGRPAGADLEEQDL